MFLENIFGKTLFILLHLYNRRFSDVFRGLKWSGTLVENGLTCILIAADYYFFFYISEKYLQFRKKQKHLLGKTFGSPHTSNQVYLLQNYFSNYVYLKDMYITLKGIEKTLFVSVLRILLIC